MATIVLPDVDRSTIDELRKHLPNLAEVDLPKMQDLGRQADETIDRLRGRSRTPAWPWWAWLATALGVMAIVGGIAYLMTWRRSSSSWSSGTTDPWTEDALSSMDNTVGNRGMGGSYGSSGSYGSTEIDVTGSESSTGGLGLSAAEASLMSTDPIDDRSA